jgi:methyl-accepting chemotaxis protein
MRRIANRVQDTARTVDSLGSRSDQIGAIVATIEDIADQTNLLALNAAIEAARAGEMGRGFAVVADEVRALAERTTKATREIGEMIKAIQSETKSAVNAMNEGVREVEAGTHDAERSGAALEQILVEIDAVADQVRQISTAAEEQSATTGEITDNIHRMTQIIQDTARGSHETADAASNLSGMAEGLQGAVSRFRLH